MQARVLRHEARTQLGSGMRPGRPKKANPAGLIITPGGVLRLSGASPASDLLECGPSPGNIKAHP